MPTRTPRQDVVERNIGNRQRRAAPMMASGIGILLGIGREHHAR